MTSSTVNLATSYWKDKESHSKHRTTTVSKRSSVNKPATPIASETNKAITSKGHRTEEVTTSFVKTAAANVVSTQVGSSDEQTKSYMATTVATSIPKPSTKAMSQSSTQQLSTTMLSSSTPLLNTQQSSLTLKSSQTMKSKSGSSSVSTTGTVHYTYSLFHTTSVLGTVLLNGGLL